MSGRRLIMTSVPNPSLDAGLAALKQGNYERAIAHLEGVRETELDEALVTRASMGLVIAYRKSGATQNAIALCQPLTQHPDPKVKQWATKTLAELTAEPSATLNPNDLGLPSRDAELSNPSQQVIEAQAQPNHPDSDSTGFVAFEHSPSKPKTPQQGIPSTIKQRPVGSTNRRLNNAKTQDPRRTEPSLTPSQDALPVPAAENRDTSAPTTENPAPLPTTDSPASTPHPSSFTPRPSWRNSGRAQNWSPLKPLKLGRLWFVEIVTAITFVWLLHFVVRLFMQTTNTILVNIPYLNPIQWFYQDPYPTIGVFLVILLIVSPWLIDWLLKQFHGLESLSLAQLASRSPEAAKVVQRISRQRRIPLPTLGVLPTDAPVAMAYGNLSRTARIIVSRGLLEQLADDEIATIFAGQLGYIIHWDFVLMSLGVLIIQIPYTIYWQVADWGEQLPDLIRRRWRTYPQFLSPILSGITGVIASVSYGVYWLLRIPLLWLSKARVYYSDRLALETTGNPNGMTRALLKIAIGITEDIQTLTTTSWLLESFDLLLPIGYRQALAIGSCSSQTPFEKILTWDCTNSYRDWLVLTTSHPLIGERLAMLARYAQFWNLDTELDLPPLTPPLRSNTERLSKLANTHKALPLLQTALLYGLIIGLTFRGILWAVGQIGDFFNIWQVIWMHNATPFLNACILIAFSLSIFLWINGYFPDIKPAISQAEPDVGDLFANSTTLPPDRKPIQLTGKLLGRRGLSNWVAQDLILQTSTGLVKLHFSSFLGPFGNLLPQSLRPSSLVEKQVTVSGWFRRGATPWIDIETLRTQGGRVARANYPLWITILALVAAVWGAYAIWEA